MKKTLVALAAAAAVTGAMAEVTISGFVDKAVQTTTTTSSTGAKTTVNSVGSNGIAGQDQMTFAVSEDLGDGNTGYAAMVLNFDTSTSNTASPLMDTGSGVGLKGAFGNIFIGNVYNQVWLTMAAGDASNWGAGNTGTPYYNTNGVAGKANSITYTLPSLAQGLDIVLEQSYAEASAGTGVGDATGLGISYTSGAFFVKYAATQLKTSSGTTSFNTYDGAGVANTTASTYDGSTASYQAVAMTYDLGVAKLWLGAQTMSMNDSGDAAENKQTFGVTIPFGAASIGWGHGTAVYTNSSNVQQSLSGDKILARYNLSKRTTIYGVMGKQSQSGASTALTNAGIGLYHSF